MDMGECVLPHCFPTPERRVLSKPPTLLLSRVPLIITSSCYQLHVGILVQPSTTMSITQECVTANYCEKVCSVRTQEINGESTRESTNIRKGEVVFISKGRVWGRSGERARQCTVQRRTTCSISYIFVLYIKAAAAGKLELIHTT